VLKNQHSQSSTYQESTMPARRVDEALTRRERQVMDILFRRGEGTVSEVMTELPDPPTYSAVRSILRILTEKGLITHKEDGPRYVYLPAKSAERAQEDALKHVVRTFFDGSAEQAVTALLRISDAELNDAEIQRLRERIRTARSSGR
jgi:BlaI family transcriptional regulator, penicillinase repressor